MPAGSARPHRGLFWTAILLALVVVWYGVMTAVRGYLATTGPASAVRGYFAALERADAPAALAYGNLPAGPDALLTSAVLREQQHIAPIRDVRVTAIQRSGSTALVDAQYTLGYAGDPQPVADTLQVRHLGTAWRLVHTAVAIDLDLTEAADRASVLGTPLPGGPALVFPGAVPVSFDTPYLQIDPSSGSVAISSPTDVGLTVTVSPLGRAAGLSALAAALRSCLGGTAPADPRCPIPSDRYVPGGVHGSYPPSTLTRATFRVSPDPAGVITVSLPGLPVTGQYTILDFDNQPEHVSGVLSLPVSASMVAATPLVVRWSAP